MYGEGDLAQTELFEGGYCNFGYWETVPAFISPQFRAETSKALYQEVLKVLLPVRGGQDCCLIEVGAGRGYGARVAVEDYSARHVMAIDQSPMQIERLRRCQIELVDAGRLDASVGSAEALPVEGSAFDALYSVEALQHFYSKKKFAQEAARVLRPNGRLAVTTFFLNEAVHFNAVSQMIPTVEHQITRVTPIGDFALDLEQNGFQQVRIHSIGAKVFPGFDRWLETVGDNTGDKGSWGRNWLKCYLAGLIDYYLVDATRSENAGA
jgi:ubiquinone/menaquinone biosynthesis C-methylase UbiE